MGAAFGTLLRGDVIESQSRLSITVVIPVLDDARPLERCLEALARQTRAADEIVMVDNGCTDESAQIARSFGARVVPEPIRGIPRASAAGYDAATGQVIARLDADSQPDVDWLERIERIFHARPDVDFVTGEALFYGATPLVHWLGRYIYIGGMYAVLAPFLGHSPLFGSNMAMRASAWRALSDEVHREDLRIHDDLDLSFHIRPDMGVIRDRELVVAVSARPFDSWSSLKRRLSWVLPTVRLHWPQESLSERRRERRRSRRRTRRQASPVSERDTTGTRH